MKEKKYISKIPKIVQIKNSKEHCKLNNLNTTTKLKKKIENIIQNNVRIIPHTIRHWTNEVTREEREPIVNSRRRSKASPTYKTLAIYESKTETLDWSKPLHHCRNGYESDSRANRRFEELWVIEVKCETEIRSEMYRRLRDFPAIWKKGSFGNSREPKPENWGKEREEKKMKVNK